LADQERQHLQQLADQERQRLADQERQRLQQIMADRVKMHQEEERKRLAEREQLEERKLRQQQERERYEKQEEERRRQQLLDREQEDKERQQIERERLEKEQRRQVDEKQEEEFLAQMGSGPPDDSPTFERSVSPSTESVLRGAEAAAQGIAEDLREGENVLRGLRLDDSEALMGNETAHLKRPVTEEETSIRRQLRSSKKRNKN
jgi:hypothetical protein